MLVAQHKSKVSILKNLELILRGKYGLCLFALVIGVRFKFFLSVVDVTAHF